MDQPNPIEVPILYTEDAAPLAMALMESLRTEGIAIRRMTRDEDYEPGTKVIVLISPGFVVDWSVWTPYKRIFLTCKVLPVIIDNARKPALWADIKSVTLGNESDIPFVVTRLMQAINKKQ